ncbi:hypothetical protein FACS1894122_06310 [Alphaproteobacteria bacterium]|nr:hypothetical protein FACS1894122_06310 [Alphaproteobacteria bacterium]
MSEKDDEKAILVTVVEHKSKFSKIKEVKNKTKKVVVKAIVERLKPHDRPRKALNFFTLERSL